MIRVLSLSLAQLGDRAFINGLLKSLALTFAIFALLYAARDAALLQGFHQTGGLAAGALAVLFGIVATWFLFRAIAVLVMGIFIDAIVEAVEIKHYPHQASLVNTISVGQTLALAARSTLRSIGYNLLALPLDRRYWMNMIRKRRVVLGGVVTGLLMLPIVNFLALLIGASIATHLFHTEIIT